MQKSLSWAIISWYIILIKGICRHIPTLRNAGVSPLRIASGLPEVPVEVSHHPASN